MNKPFAITLDINSSLANKTGTWRTQRPVYVDRLPPCNNACPAGENIQQWLYHAEEGNYEAAWREIMKNNPMPAVMGRVCYHPCEGACNRAKLDSAVGIHAVERFLSDLAIRSGWRAKVEKAPTGRRVLVYGCGNTAMDVARTPKRLGASGAIVVYRRTRDKMPAHDFEVQEAMDEGVIFKWLTTIKAEKDGEFTVEKMRLDDKGKPQPTGEFETMTADSCVLALGQDVDLSFLERVPGLSVVDGVVQVGPDMMTGCRGVFAGGDMVPAERTVTVAVGHGKKAARCIDAYLNGSVYAPAPKHEIAEFDLLNTRYYTDAPPTVQPTLEAARRNSTFAEVVGGLDHTNALFEARRCL